MNKVLVGVIILIAALVTAGIFVGIYILAQFSGTGGIGETYEETLTYYHRPNDPASIQNVQFETGISNIVINYVTTSDYYVKAEMSFKITGPDAASKDYTDWFDEITWYSTSSGARFKLTLKPDVWNTFTTMDNVLTISLRRGIVFDIKAFTSTGDVDITIPSGIIVDDFEMGASTGSASLDADGAVFNKGMISETSSGSTTLDFSSCVMGGNINAKVSTGTLTFKSNNMQYSKESIWNLESSTGDIDIEITQNTDMKNDVTGDIIATSGAIGITYTDNSANIGARFACDTSTGGISFSGSGFSQSGDVFTSNDFNSAIRTYNLNLETTSGAIKVDGTSA